MTRFASLKAAAGTAATALVLVLVATTASASSSLPTLTVALDGKTVTVGGQMVSGAVNIQTTVAKEKIGEPFLVRLAPGATVQQGFAAIQSHHGDLNALNGIGTIVFNQDANPGVTLGQTVLAPGNYAALDTANAGNGKPPPFTTFTVTPSPSPAALPAANATETAIEFGFRGPTILHKGWTVRGVNAGYLVHMDDLSGVNSRAIGQRVVALLKAGKDRQAMKFLNNNFFSFQEPLSSGQLQQAVLNTPPGWYVQACFMNTQDGREHTQLGMVRLIRIVK